MFTEEFQRFGPTKDNPNGGHWYTLLFNSEADIICAHIHVEELGKNFDVTDFVQNDLYWQNRVKEWLAEHEATKSERKYFKAFKDVSNE